MTHPYYPSGTPRMNHVAMSVPSAALQGDERADLIRFFAEVLGFEELPTMTVDGHRLVFSCVHWDQFIFLIAEDEPMSCPRMDHYGFSVGTMDELVAARDRAVAFRDGDPRMELMDLSADDQGVVVIHSLYVRYLLPMTVELQFWEFTGARVDA